MPTLYPIMLLVSTRTLYLMMLLVSTLYLISWSFLLLSPSIQHPLPSEMVISPEQDGGTPDGDSDGDGDGRRDDVC